MGLTHHRCAPQWQLWVENGRGRFGWKADIGVVSIMRGGQTAPLALSKFPLTPKANGRMCEPTSIGEVRYVDSSK